MRWLCELCNFFTPGPTLETPWRASDHHSYGGTPSLGTPVALLTNCWTFSLSERREIKSLARASYDKDALQKEYLAVAGSFLSHAKFFWDSHSDETRAAISRETLTNLPTLIFLCFCALMDEKTVHGVVFIGGKELFIYLPLSHLILKLIDDMSWWVF